MTDNRERAIAEVAEEIGWTTEQVSYCTYSVMRIAVNQCEQKLDLLDALKALVDNVKDYEPWQRPCLALDNAIAAIAKAEKGMI